jgi:large subunit ribosomal protein L5
MNRRQQEYKEKIIPQLKNEWHEKNDLAIPQLVKIVINIGMGLEQGQKETIKNMSEQVAQITGQQPVTTKAKKSIAGFKIRQGDEIGIKVTLRGNRMYDFFDKLVSIALPRVRDFQGIKRNSFDGNGNYTLGISEQLIFPEINYDKIDKVRGLEITIITNAKTDEKAMRLLELMGMPFEN